MVLKNLMEEKQLNFDQPLLSTRRYPSTVSNSESGNRRKRTDNALCKVPPIPKYKSELKSGPVRNPGTVPFVWEQMPGRPKNESKPQAQIREYHAITAPKLPPGRILNMMHEASDAGSEVKAANNSQEKKGQITSQNLPFADKIITKEVSNEVEPEETGLSDKEDGSSVYVDAVDTLSRCESFFMTCSLSGVSGLEGTDLRLPETYPTDPQARDFMINRFLPAAKAMASETPQHSDKRHLVPKEQQTKKIVTVTKPRPPNPYKPNNLPYYTQSDMVEDSNDDDDYNAADNIPHNLCGLLPRLCLQNSFCLLNPVPGIRKQPVLPIKSVRTRNLNSSYVSIRETQNKREKDAPFEKRFSYGHQARGIHEAKDQLQGRSDQFFSRNGHKKLDGSSTYRDLPDRGVNAYHKKGNNKDIGFPRIPEKAQSAKGNNRVEKDGSNLQQLFVNESNEWAATSVSSSMVERTLYIDSVQTVKPKSSDFNYPDTITPDSNGNEVQMLVNNPKIEVTVPVDSSGPDSAQNNCMLEKPEVRPQSMKSPDYSSLLSSDKSFDDFQLKVTDGSAHFKDIEKDSLKSPHHKVDEDGKTGLESQQAEKLSDSASLYHINHNPAMVASSKFDGSEMIDLESRFPVRPGDGNSSASCNIMQPLPPPLPKSPSESWLKRALPAVASRNSSKPPFATSIDSPKAHNFDPKWETIVRTTNVQHGHFRFSEELLAPIPEA